MAVVFVERLAVERELVSDDERGQWPFTIPCVAAIARDGLELRRPVTFLVGENGSGKSTLVEAIAEAAGLDARWPRWAQVREPAPDDAARRGDAAGPHPRGREDAPARQEQAQGLLPASGNPIRPGGSGLGATRLLAGGSVFDADIIEVGDFGLRRVAWADLAITDHWRRYLTDPSAYLRHLIDP